MKLTILPDAGGPTTVALSGEVDLATAGELEGSVERLVASGITNIVVDLKDVTFCDSVGLNVLVRARKYCAEHGGQLRIIRPRGEVAQVLSISGLLDHLASEEA
jgi:anti-sigma B factor antagonist